MKKHLLFSFLLLYIGYLPAQDLTIKGKITSAETGKPLPGVNVRIKGVPDSTFTKGDGTYEIKFQQNFYNPISDPALIFYHDGFETLEVDLREEQELDAALLSEAAELEEVVMSGSASGQTRKMLSYAADRIDAEQFAASPPYLGLGLQGKVAGLRVNQVGGQPGQGAFFQIRSANALANGQQPLIIVDGAFLNGSTLADLNPEDVDRIEVLKGPAATSLYGSQAANGVIQVFTKRGKDLGISETRVIYRGEIGFTEEANRYDLNTLTHRTILDPDGPQPILGGGVPGETFVNTLPNLQDYQDTYLFAPGLLQSHSLSIAGKTEKTNFLTSFQRMEDQGVVPAFSGYLRNALRLNLDHQVSNRFDLSVSSMYSTSTQDLLTPMVSGPGSYLSGLLLLTPIFDLDASNEEDGSSFDWDIDNTGQNITNPLYNERNTSQNVSRTRLLGSATAQYEVSSWLDLSYSAALDRSVNQYDHFVEKGYLSTSAPGRFGPLVTAGNQSNGGGIHRTSRTSSSLISRASAMIHRSFSGFKTSLRASYLYENLQHEFNGALGENLAVEEVRSLDNARDNILIASEKQNIVARSSFLVADIDYKEKFSFSGLVRREGSSLFGPEERWSNYYRISGAYRITEDLKIPRFRELKLRATVGTAGIRPTFEQRFETFELVNGALRKNTLGNNFLRPSLSREMEVGINATFLRAFNLEFNYAAIETEDQILLAPLTGAAGFRGQWRNAGALSAKVYEAGLNIDFAKLFKVRSRHFHWDLRTTFDRIEQRVSRLDVPAYTTGPGLEFTNLFLVEEGAPFGVMVGEVFATSADQLAGQEGINPADFTFNEAGYLVHTDQLGTPEERPYKLRDANGNPLIQTIGDINPDFRMGFANILSYQGLQLYTLFDWKKGGDVYNLTRQWLYRDLRHAEVSRYADIAAGFFGNDGLANDLAANHHFVEDGSFFMLREASLSYTFGKKQLAFFLNGFVESIRFSLIGRNLFTVTDYTGFHPDVASMPRGEHMLTNRDPGALGSDIYTPNGDPSLFAVDAFNYPLRRSYAFSLQVTF